MIRDPIILAGYRGNMGRRYASILNHLEIPWIGTEHGGVVWDNRAGEQVSELPTLTKFHSIIIATPTFSHMTLIKKYRHLGVPMLCEKPITFDLDDIKVLDLLGVEVAMVNQYKFIYGQEGQGNDTWYEYYKSGADGLAWDCISLIALAEEKPYLSNKSPVWSAGINGKSLNISAMDYAYINMLEEWIANPKGDLEYIEMAHKRVVEGFYHEESYYRGSGAIDKRETARQDQQGNSEGDDAAESPERLPKDSRVRKRSKRA